MSPVIVTTISPSGNPIPSDAWHIARAGPETQAWAAEAESPGRVFPRRSHTTSERPRTRGLFRPVVSSSSAYEGATDALRGSSSPLRLRRARAAHRRADDADPPRQAPPGVRG